MKPWELARLAVGVAEITVPRALARAAGEPADERAVVTMRVLGCRDVVQAVVLGRTTRPGLLRAGAAVDGLHAASMLGLASVGPRRARLSLASAALATSWSVATLARARPEDIPEP